MLFNTSSTQCCSRLDYAFKVGLKKNHVETIRARSAQEKNPCISSDKAGALKNRFPLRLELDLSAFGVNESEIYVRLSPTFFGRILA